MEMTVKRMPRGLVYAALFFQMFGAFGFWPFNCVGKGRGRWLWNQIILHL